MTPVTFIRQCSRPGCSKPAIATLEFNYASQVAIIGALIVEPNPHRWDLCENHARRTTAPQGWELTVTNPYLNGQETLHQTYAENINDDELNTLAEAVRQAQEYEVADSARIKEREEQQRATRVQRKSDTPMPTGRHPARQNLPAASPRRHLRAIKDEI